MYKTILVPIENSGADRTILEHVESLASLTGARVIVMHVAAGTPPGGGDPQAKPNG